MSRSIKSLQDMRSVFAQFCADRDWQQFHLPTNLLLALSGECGEVSEIYQWKGSLESSNWKEFLPTKFTAKEIIHIGEELADVCIYSVRLADVCNIDLAHAVRKALGIRCEKSRSYEKDLEQTKESWEDISFEHMGHLAESYVNAQKGEEEELPRSQRRVILSLHHSLGVVCQLFGSRSEVDNQVGLPLWSPSDLQAFADGLALIIVALSRLAAFSSLSLSQCILDKLAKNEVKYPVALAKGSSEKYTAYADKLQLKKPQETGSTAVTTAASVSISDANDGASDSEKKQHDSKKVKDLMKRMEDIEDKLPAMVLLLVLAALALGYAVGRYA